MIISRTSSVYAFSPSMFAFLTLCNFYFQKLSHVFAGLEKFMLKKVAQKIIATMGDFIVIYTENVII